MGAEVHLTEACKGAPTNNARMNRRFHPYQVYKGNATVWWSSGRYDGTLIDGLDKNFTFLPCTYHKRCRDCGRQTIHSDQILVAIKGTSKGEEETTESRSAIGIFFAQKSEYNTTRLFEDSAAASTRAELTACLDALRRVHSLHKAQAIIVTQCVIKTDSANVVDGMTELIFKWKHNGFEKSRGGEVANYLLYYKIDEKVEEMNEDGIEVLFWRVPRAENQDAENLANKAFEEENG